MRQAATFCPPKVDDAPVGTDWQQEANYQIQTVALADAPTICSLMMSHLATPGRTATHWNQTFQDPQSVFIKSISLNFIFLHGEARERLQTRISGAHI